ncbi:MAG: ergothioneine biosynthesis protein EgtB [Flavobacteriales bacterium]
MSLKDSLTARYRIVRQRSESICQPLETEDYVVQPIVDVSPPKWHLGHTTWFFETFVLSEDHRYAEYNSEFNFVFNSYYESIGKRVVRTDRGNLSRPSVSEVYKYRSYVDENMERLFSEQAISNDVLKLIELGLNHEEQHQELLLCDIKYILGHNPLLPAYNDIDEHPECKENSWVTIAKGKHQIGYGGNDFHFDNEAGKHTVWLEQFELARELVTNEEYIEFINDGGYQRFEFWHAEGWNWVQENNIKAPEYWHFEDKKWLHYTLAGLQEVKPNTALSHISYYEAAAFAEWKGMRLPTEFEWEAAHAQLTIGNRWEWTNSAYLPYPGFHKEEGAIGEYNGKFMINQMVLRGGSIATPHGHFRPSYRNFFHPNLRWQYTGIRLAKKNHQ